MRRDDHEVRSKRGPSNAGLEAAAIWGGRRSVWVSCVRDKMRREPDYEPSRDPRLPAWVVEEAKR